MNKTTTSAPGSSLLPDSTDLFTGAHLVLVAVLAVLVIAGIVFGMRLAHRRRQAQHELAEHNQHVCEHATPAATPERDPPNAATPTPPRAEPVASAPIDTAAADGPVTQLKGLGPKVATRLGELGITTVGQIAALSDDEATALDAQLGAFAGRMGRDRWQEQARFLAAGDRAGFESVFGRL